jgi:membrane protein DedA with SNARE-associated domain
VCTTSAPRATDAGYTDVLVVDLIEHFTYAGIFLVLFVAGLGLPVPEEIPILAAGALASNGVVRWWLALLVCIVGALAGDTALYWVGRHWGEHVLDWRITRLVLTPDREESCKRAYLRHGVKIVFTARFVAGFRAAAFLTAGVTHVPFRKFLAVDGVAALIGIPLSFGVAFLFTDQLAAIVRGVHRFERILALVVLALVTIVIVFVAYRRSRRPV